MNMDYKITCYSDYKNKIRNLFADFVKNYENHPDISLKESMEVLKRGYSIAEDITMDHVDVLITGMNPSEKGEKIPNGIEYPAFKIPVPKDSGQYWQAINKYYNKDYKFEHVDIFALRERHQKFLTEMGDNKKALDFFVKQLFLTQNLIESIHPKLIVVSNKSAFAYWGKLINYTWMGYTFKSLWKDSTRDLELMEITGLSGYDKKNLPIGKTLDSSFETQLTGTKILFARYQANGCPKEKRITSKDIDLCLNK